MLINYFALGMVLLQACTVVPRDLERRTIYPLVARPLPRLAYLGASS